MVGSGGSWSLDDKELFLLSYFPRFRGMGGSLIPGKVYDLLNFSKCLGSYALLYGSGDFMLVGSCALHGLAGGGGGVDVGRLSDLCLRYGDAFLSFVPEVIDFMSLRWMLRRTSPYSLIVPPSVCFASNVYSFAERYLGFLVGEPVYSEVGVYNTRARELVLDIIHTLKRRAESVGDEALLRFSREFLRYPYGDSGPAVEPSLSGEGGGLGIIYTVINLGGE